MNTVCDAVAFDIDGTLYPNYRFYRQLIPFVLRHAPFLAAFAKARNQIRAAAREFPAKDEAGGFYRLQARVMAEFLQKDAEETRQKTQKLIYDAWPAHFKKVRLFPYARETIEAIRARGMKTALLSDFPLGEKLDNLRIAGLWDAALCSEELGMLKPHAVSFLELAARLGLPPERILFAGNSLRCDIAGAKGAGMKAALITANPVTIMKARRMGEKKPDCIFSDYRTLRSFVLG